jgi:hypothetical protein
MISFLHAYIMLFLRFGLNSSSQKADLIYTNENVTS